MKTSYSKPVIQYHKFTISTIFIININLFHTKLGWMFAPCMKSIHP